MSETERPRPPADSPTPEGLGNPFALGGGDADGAVEINYNVYHEQLPLGGRTVGEIRRIVGPRYDIALHALALIDGQTATDDVVVHAGQSVRFMHHAGEKGQGPPPQLEDPFQGMRGSLIGQALGLHPKIARRRPAAPKISIEGETVTVRSPEGHTAALKLEALLALLDRGGPHARDARDVMLPDGVKWVISRSGHTMLVHQTSPAIHNLKWIAADSPARYGPETTYRQVRIALPYVVVFALFEPRSDGLLRLSNCNEAFFRTEPLRSPDDGLLYPALLNCSRFDNPAKPLSWICTQHLSRTRMPATSGLNERLRQGMEDLTQCLFGAGFNYSSDEHEISSWFTESRNIDPRVSTIEHWEKATRADPMFALEMPWLPVNHNVRQVADRTLGRHAGTGGRARSSRDLARLLYNHGKIEEPKEGRAER